MYLELDEYLRSLRASGSPLLENTLRLWKLYPDLRAFRDHIGCVRLCSAAANPIVDTVDITHRTDSGGSLEIMAFVYGTGDRVYADPPIYVVGYANALGFGEIPLVDWEELLADNNIARTVILKVRDYLGRHQAVNYDQVPD